MASKMITALVMLALASVSVSGGNYYCSEDLQCDNGISVEPNVLCEKPIAFAPKCIKPQYVSITDELKKVIVDEHNKLRNKLAAGLVGGVFKYTASDMTTMSYDDELEYLAIPNAMQCEMKHDKCRITSQYRTAGQNLAYSCSSPTAPSTVDAFTSAINDWFNEYRDVPNINEVKKLDSSGATKPIGHFTQMAQSKANRVGCAATRYLKDNTPNAMQCLLLACNYNAGNLIGYEIFDIGPPASKCETGPNPIFPALCDVGENVTRMENGEIYFNPAGAPSPVVAEWLKNGKKLNIAKELYASADSTASAKQSTIPLPARPSPSRPSPNAIPGSSPVFAPGQTISLQTKTSYVNGKKSIQYLANGKPITQAEYDQIVRKFSG